MLLDIVGVSTSKLGILKIFHGGLPHVEKG